MARKFDIDSKVQDWYMDAYPKDVLRKAIDENATFRDVVECLNRNKNPMFMLGLHDSFVRDRIFGKVAVMSGVSFDVVYNKWSLGNEAPDVPMHAFGRAGIRDEGLGIREGISEFANSEMITNGSKTAEGNAVGGNGMNIEILSFEECDDKDYGETVVQFRHGEEVSFCFTELTVQNILANPNKILMEIQEYEIGAGDRLRPLWSDLSQDLLEAVLYNPFDMHFVEYENFDVDVDVEKLEERLFDEVNRLGIYGAVTCGEDGALLTVYAGAMGAINWKGHPTYGEPCFETELDKGLEKESEKLPYRVVITETYTREVVVYAEDSLDAEQMAEDLCNNSVIDLIPADFSARSTECRGVARESDLKIHEVYGVSSRSLPAGVKLLDDQIAEAVAGKTVSDNARLGARDLGRGARE